MIETMSDRELADALRASQERMRQLLNEQHRRGDTDRNSESATVGAVARQAALRALRADHKTVLAIVAIMVIMVGFALVNAIKAVTGL
jgi:hypothetical protein